MFLPRASLSTRVYANRLNGGPSALQGWAISHENFVYSVCQIQEKASQDVVCDRNNKQVSNPASWMGNSLNHGV